MTDFHGEPTNILENKFLQLEYLSKSLRIVRFSPKGKANLFADTGLDIMETPYGNFYLRGGHRLWHSPEAMPRTYIPDNEGGLVTEIPNGVRIEMPTESWTHISKSIEIQLNSNQPQVILRHELRNDGAWPVQFSAWAVTMFKLGGLGIFPQPIGNTDEAGLLSNRKLILWPYTQTNDSRLILRDDFVLIHAKPNFPPIKFGYFNPHGWIAYWLEGVLFVKRFEAHEEMQYPDHGCNAESYCNDKFLELESLGALTTVLPGQTITHTEFWEVYDNLDLPFISNEIRHVVAQINK